MPLRYDFVLFRAALLGFVLMPPILCSAQQAAAPEPSPSLDQILTRVHENFRAYLSSLPNLFADQHLASSMSAHGEDDVTVVPR